MPLIHLGTLHMLPHFWALVSVKVSNVSCSGRQPQQFSDLIQKSFFLTHLTLRSVCGEVAFDFSILWLHRL